MLELRDRVVREDERLEGRKGGDAGRDFRQSAVASVKDCEWNSVRCVGMIARRKENEPNNPFNCSTPAQAPQPFKTLPLTFSQVKVAAEAPTNEIDVSWQDVKLSLVRPARSSSFGGSSRALLERSRDVDLRATFWGPLERP